MEDDLIDTARYRKLLTKCWDTGEEKRKALVAISSFGGTCLIIRNVTINI